MHENWFQMKSSHHNFRELYPRQSNERTNFQLGWLEQWTWEMCTRVTYLGGHYYAMQVDDHSCEKNVLSHARLHFSESLLYQPRDTNPFTRCSALNYIFGCVGKLRIGSWGSERALSIKEDTIETRLEELRLQHLPFHPHRNWVNLTELFGSRRSNGASPARDWLIALLTGH